MENKIENTLIGKLKSMIMTINNMEKMFEGEDVEVIFALEELKEQIADIIRECK
jgi:TusA-related sulfurtransferase